MAALFDIQASETTFTFDGDRQAVATFVVTNRAGRAMRARAQLVPQEQGQRAWYRIEGIAERAFDADQEQTHEVRIDVPADVPPGSYGFRFDMVDVGNPDEFFELGPDVIIRIPEPPPPPVEEAKPFPWKIAIGVGAGVVVLLAVLVWVLTRGGADTRFVTVPDVSGLTQQSAQERLEGTLEGTCETPPCLSVLTTLRYEAASPFSGRVETQAPEPGSEVEEGSDVTIRVLGVSDADVLDRWIVDGVVDNIYVEFEAMEELPVGTVQVICKYDGSLKGC